MPTDDKPRPRLVDTMKAKQEAAFRAATGQSVATATPAKASKSTAETMAELRTQLPASPKIKPATPEQVLAETTAACGGDTDFARLLHKAIDAIEPYVTAWNKSKGGKVKIDVRAFGETFDELVVRRIAETEWLVRRLVPKRAVGSISSEPKIAKTWTAMDIAVSIASGTSAFGKFEVVGTASAFYFFAEDPDGSVKSRGLAIEAGKDIADTSWRKRLTVQGSGRLLDLTDANQVCVLIASAWRAAERGGAPLGLVVLDPLRDVHTAKEDSSDAMTPVMHMLRAMRDILGCTIMFVHHSAKTSTENKDRKRGGQKMRGSSAIHGALDFGIYMDDPRGDRETTFINRVESELKSARGAGKFDLTLSIVDDANDVAVKATHAVSECAPVPGRKDTTEDKSVAVVHALFDHCAPMLRDVLKRKLRCGSDVLDRALDLAVKDGYIVQRTRAQGAGFLITEAGKEYVRKGRKVEQEPEPPPDVDLRDPLGLGTTMRIQ
jgi:hypothetical protein